MRRVVLTLVLLSLPVGVSAGKHRAGASVAYRATEGSTLNGVLFSFEWVICPEGDLICPTLSTDEGVRHKRRKRTLSLVAEYGVVWGEQEREDISQTTLQGGLRYVLSKHDKYQPFAQVLAGRFFTGGEDWLAGTFGFGLDWLPFESRESPGFRFQYDRSWIAFPLARWYNQGSFQFILRFE